MYDKGGREGKKKKGKRLTLSVFLSTCLCVIITGKVLVRGEGKVTVDRLTKEFVRWRCSVCEWMSEALSE